MSGLILSATILSLVTGAAGLIDVPTDQTEPGKCTVIALSPDCGQTACEKVCQRACEKACQTTCQVVRCGDQVVVGGPQRKVLITTVGAADEGEETEVVELPGVWIGVRMSPIPAPLAAHIGERGLMIANVVEDSPAEAAELKRYDVILALDGAEIDGTEALIEAIGEVGADNTAQMTIIRGGEKKTVLVTPAKRPQDVRMELLYDEPDDTLDSLQLRGRTLRMAPGGNWILEDLGELKNLPKPLDDLLFKLKTVEPQTLKWLDEHDFDFDIDWDGKTFFFGDTDEHKSESAQVEIQIKVDDDGKVLMIHRNEDGTIRVARTDEDGKETAKTYKNLEELEADDREAFKVLGNLPQGERRVLRLRQPGVHVLPKLRDNFQIQIERHLKDAREQAHKAHEMARDVHEKVAARAHKQAKVLIREQADEQRTVTAEKLMVTVDEDGHVTVVIDEDGKRIEYEFEDKDDFKAREPKLYERFRKLTD